MDSCRLGKTVSESHIENVADPPLDRRTRDLAIESPGFECGSRSDRPIDLARLKINRNDGPADVRLGGRVSELVGLVRVSRGCMHDPDVVGVGMCLVFMIMVVLGHGQS
jgi:hypothetical protein